MSAAGRSVQPIFVRPQRTVGNRTVRDQSRFAGILPCVALKISYLPEANPDQVGQSGSPPRVPYWITPLS